jgi:hypothetical protein
MNQPRITLYAAECRGNPANNLYPQRIDVTDVDALRRAVAFDHVAAEYRGGRRSIANFVAADCLMMDCDNDHSEAPADWKTSQDVAAAFPGVGFLGVLFAQSHEAKARQSSPPKIPRIFSC